MMDIKVLFTAAVLAAVTSTAASAAVIDVFASGSFGARGTMNLAGLIDDDNDASKDTVRFDFNVTEEEGVVVDNFSVTGNGFSSGNDLGNIRYGFDAGSGFTFEDINVRGNVANATGFLNNRSFSAGSKFSFFFDEIVPGQNSKKAFVNLTFTTDPVPSPVPVPAAGLLLLSAIGAGGLAARAKRKV